MPLFSFRCTACDNAFESLVRSDETPECPACHSTALEKQVSRIAPEGRVKGFLQAKRGQAAREGHFSNFSKSELKGKS
jgi:putative FmdB family regulatory protein